MCYNSNSFLINKNLDTASDSFQLKAPFLFNTFHF